MVLGWRLELVLLYRHHPPLEWPLQAQMKHHSSSINQCQWLTHNNDPPSSLKQQLTHLDPLALNIGLLVESLTGLHGGWRATGDLTLRHAKVLQQSGNLALEVHATGVLQHRDQVQLQVLAHTAHLRLSQSRGQVGWGAQENRLRTKVVGLRSTLYNVSRWNSPCSVSYACTTSDMNMGRCLASVASDPSAVVRLMLEMAGCTINFNNCSRANFPSSHKVS